PVTVWTTCVFAKNPNPTHIGPYFILEMPELLVDDVLYLRFADRFLWKDCGPVTMILIVLGMIAAVCGRAWIRPLLGWTLMGVGFYFVMGPMLRCHDYYELMMLPAAAMWAALGWRWLTERIGILSPLPPQSWVERGQNALDRLGFMAILLLLILIHSPWVLHGKSDADATCVAAARHLAKATPPTGRVAVIAGDSGVAIAHYPRREGWVSPRFLTFEQQREWLERCRERGAKVAVIFRERSQSLEEGEACDQLADEYEAIVRSPTYVVVRLGEPSPTARR